MKLQYQMGIILIKMKWFHEAESEFRAVVEETFKTCVELFVYEYAWKAYEWLASMFYEQNCFATAF